MKLVLSGFGLVGALMIALIGFGPADAGSDYGLALSAGVGADFVIVGHGGGLGPCGYVEPSNSSLLNRLGDGC